MNKEAVMKKRKKGTRAKFAGAALCFALAMPVMLTGCGGKKDGQDGKDGATWLSGIENPTNSQGKVGDFYLDTDDFLIYQKTENEWIYIGSIKPKNTFIAYSRNADGSDFSLVWQAGYNYIGVAVSASTEAPTSKEAYTWSLIKGEQGQASFVHIMYATSASGENMSATWSAGKDYIGVYADYNQTASNNPADYSWSKFVGETLTPVSVSDVKFVHKIDADGNKYIEITTEYSNGLTDLDVVWTEKDIYVGNVMTLDKALEIVGDNQRIALVKDLELSDTFEVNKKVVLNLNGYKISVNQESDWQGDNSLIKVLEKGDLTITTDGNHSGEYADMIMSDSADVKYAIEVAGGTFTLAEDESVGGYEKFIIGQESAVYVSSGSAIINGGYLSVMNEANPGDKVLDKLDGSTATIVINNAQFVNFNPVYAQDGNLVAVGKFVVWAEMQPGIKSYMMLSEADVFSRLSQLPQNMPVGITLTQNLMLPENGMDILEGYDLTIDYYNNYQIIPYQAPDAAGPETYSEPVNNSYIRVHAGARLTIDANLEINNTVGTQVSINLPVMINSGATTVINIAEDCTVPIAPKADLVSAFKFEVVADNLGNKVLETTTSFADAGVLEVKEPVKAVAPNQAEVKVGGDVSIYDALVAVANQGTITLTADIDINRPIKISKDVTINMNGKKIYNTSNIWEVNEHEDSALVMIKGASVVVTGNGTFEAAQDDCYAIDLIAGSLVIENGTYIGNVSAIQVVTGTLEVKGGSFDLKQKVSGERPSRFMINRIDTSSLDGTANVVIKGGEFNDYDPSNTYCDPEQPNNLVAAGYSIIKTGNVYKVFELSTLQATLDEAGAATLILLEDVLVDRPINISYDLTLNMNGKKIYNTTPIWERYQTSDNALIKIYNADVVVTGNGVFDALQDDCYGIDLVSGSLLIENGTFNCNVTNIQVQTGSLEIRGGNFDLKQLYPDARYMINCIDTNFGTSGTSIVIKGGVFNGYDPANIICEPVGANFVAAEHVVVQTGTQFEVMTIAELQNRNITRLVSEGYTKVESTTELAVAIDNGEDVVLAANIDFGEFDTVALTIAGDANVVIDLNGFTITGTDTMQSQHNGLITNKGTLTIRDSAEGGSIQVTASTSQGTSKASCVIRNTPSVGDVNLLTIESGTIKHCGGTQLSYAIDCLSTSEDTNCVITGGVIIAEGYCDGIRMFVNSVTAENNLTITGGTIDAVWMQGSPNTGAVCASLVITGDAEVEAVYTTIRSGDITNVSVSVDAVCVGTAENYYDYTAELSGNVELVENDGVYTIVYTSAE